MYLLEPDGAVIVRNSRTRKHASNVRTMLRRMSTIACATLVVCATVPKGQGFGPPGGVFYLYNARIETVSHGTIDSASVLIRDGRIEAVGREFPVPAGAVRLDCTGLTIYPGLINAGTHLGLATTGPGISSTPDPIRSLNPGSPDIASTRVQGVTAALVSTLMDAPAGRAALVSLDGFLPSDMALGFEAAAVRFPTVRREESAELSAPEPETKDDPTPATWLDEAWQDALHRAEQNPARQGGRLGARSEQEPVLLAAVTGRQPLIIEVNSAHDILRAIGWVKQRKANAIFSGVSEGWRVADQLAASGIPCIVGPVTALPGREYDRHDAVLANAGRLHAAGVRIVLQTGNGGPAADLPFHAGLAAAYGLDRPAALRALTLDAAELFGVADRLGSIEVGKSASLVVVEGDLFEPAAQVIAVFIHGRQIPLMDGQRRWYDEAVR